MTKTRLAIVLTAAAAVAALTTTTVLAAADSDDNISPPSTAYTANNSGNVTFSGTINGLPVTVTCTTSTISGTTPATGLGPGPIADPTFSGCTDNLGGNDTVKTNHINGSWQITFIDVANEAENPDAPEPNTGDSIQLGIPKAGATVVSSVLPTCTITVAPTAPTSITGAYDDISTVKFSNQSIPTSGTGCTTSANSTMNGTYVSSPGFHDVS